MSFPSAEDNRGGVQMIHIIKNCLVCGAKTLYICKEKDKVKTEKKIRATVLACGHQGMFDLEIMNIANRI